MTSHRCNSLCALLLGITFTFSFSVWMSRFLTLRCFSCPGVFKQREQRFQHLRQETNYKRFILFSVMSSENNLNTRARGIWETWGKHVPGKLIFFTGQMNQTDWKDLPVIQLNVKDDAYPPQVKSLTMLKYVFDNFLDQYQWFVRADDDVYIKTDRLSAYLKQFDNSQEIIIGQPGIGKKEELGLLGLGTDDNFCMGGPGVMMTSSVLRKFGPQLSYCLNSTVSSHEDVEVGRCIRRFSGVICPWAYEMKELFLQVYDNPLDAYHGTLNTMEMEKAINLHPVKDPAYMRRMHAHFLKSRIEMLSEKQLILHRSLDATKRLLLAERWPGHLKRHSLTRNSSRAWELFDFSKVWALNDRPPLRYIHDGTEAMMKKMLEFTKETLTRNGEKSLYHAINFSKWHSGYMRVCPRKSAEFIVDTPTKHTLHKNGKVQVTHTRYLLHVQQKFGKFIIGPATTANNGQVPLHFIVPLVGRLQNFRRFFKSFEQVFIIPGDAVKLLIVYFPDVNSSAAQKVVFQNYAKKYSHIEMKWLDVKGPFKRAVALQVGTDYFGNQSLLYYCDVDLVFQREFANRCRENAVIGKRAYFPVMFSQFNPRVTYAGKSHPGTHFYYAKEAGFWRWYSFGPVCAYAKDIIESGGLNTTLIGWGLEDVDLYEKFVRRDDIEIFRAPDPGLVHVYHPHAACDRDSSKPQRAMCFAAQADLFSSAASAVDFLRYTGKLDFPGT